MVDGGRLHGEKSGIYHFSMEGRLYKLAGHAELTAWLAFFPSVLLCVLTCVHIQSAPVSVHFLFYFINFL